MVMTDFENLNNWEELNHNLSLDERRSIWDKRFKVFNRKKNESVIDMLKRFSIILRNLSSYVHLDDKFSKLDNALPPYWDIFVKESKQNSRFDINHLHWYINHIWDKAEMDELSNSDDSQTCTDIVCDQVVDQMMKGKEQISEASTDMASCSEKLCSKCDKTELDNAKLLKDIESSTLEN